MFQYFGDCLDRADTHFVWFNPGDLVIDQSGGQTEVSAAVDAKWQLTTGLQLASVRSIGGGQLSATLVPRASSPGPLHTHVRMNADLAVICGQGKPTFDIPYQVGVDMTLQTERGGFVPTGADVDRYSGQLPGGAKVSAVGEALGNIPGRNVPGRNIPGPDVAAPQEDATS